MLLLQVVFATVGKTVYFIRHAESLWNEAKTKKRSFTEQTMDVLKKEYKDAPLTPKGLNQIRDLRNWFWKDDGSCWNHTLRCLYSSLSGELPNESSSSRDASATPSCERATPGSSWPSPHPSKVAYGVSNLHRAIETLLVFLGGRPRDDPSSPISVDIVSALQEISRNHDAETKLGRGQVPDIADGSYSAAIEGIGFPSGRSPLKYVFNGTFNEGELNTVFKEDKIARFNKFCDWVFDQTEKDTFVVSGHSFWLMYLFMASFGRAPEAASERGGGGLGGGGVDWTKRDVINLAGKILRTKNLGHIESIKLGGNASMIKL